MANDPLLAAAMQLSPAIDALAAIGARARLVEDGIEVDPRVRQLLDDIVAHVVGDEHRDPDVDPAVLGLVRTLLALGVDLVEHPDRSMGWEHTDIGLLQSIGRLSGAIAGAIDTASAADAQLHDAMHRTGGVFLDIGTGTGWLAIAIARTFPNLHVVGIDLFEPALDLARCNVRDEGLEDRIELRLQDATELDDVAAYDAIWIALPFIPRSVVPAILDAARRALRPGGVVIPGTFNRSTDPLGQMLTDLRTLRSGGHPWEPAELCDLLASTGFDGARHVERTWPAPAELFAATGTGP